MSKGTRPLPCPRCSYDLRGFAEPRCPECGRPLSAREVARIRDGLAPAPRVRWDVGFGVLRFVQTFAQIMFAPRRALLSIDGQQPVWRSIVFAGCLLPLTAALSYALLLLGDRYLVWYGMSYGQRFPSSSPVFWEMSRPERTGVWLTLAIRVVAWWVTSVLVWLPTWIALDVACRRTRPAFRVLSKGLIYTLAWWVPVGALAAGVVRCVLGAWREDMVWGYPYGWRNDGYVGWITWCAAFMIFRQAVVAQWLVAAHDELVALPRATRRLLRVVLGVGALIALYLMLYDRHIHLRFYLLYCTERWSEWVRWG